MMKLIFCVRNFTFLDAMFFVVIGHVPTEPSYGPAILLIVVFALITTYLKSLVKS